MLTEAPLPPSQKNPAAPLALEALALRLLEKKPERRTITIAQIRGHVHNYIEGIGVDYHRAPLAASLLWVVAALVLFAFLVWYLTGRSIATVLALGPPAVLNAVGWFVLVIALGYPLWPSISASGRPGRARPIRVPIRWSFSWRATSPIARFPPPWPRSFSSVFILELVSLAVSRGSIRRS
jgi:hypothetical protein